MAALEKAKEEQEAPEISSRSIHVIWVPRACPERRRRDIYYVGTIKRVGRIFIDSYSRVAAAKVNTEMTAITAADLLNDRIVPFFEEHAIKLRRVLTDWGTEYCGKPEHQAYQLYLAIEDIDHSRIKANHLQTNGICERLHRTFQPMLQSPLQEEALPDPGRAPG